MFFSYDVMGNVNELVQHNKLIESNFPDYAYKKTQMAIQKGPFQFTSQQSKILEDKTTPAQIKYEKKNFKLKF